VVSLVPPWVQALNSRAAIHDAMQAAAQLERMLSDRVLRHFAAIYLDEHNRVISQRMTAGRPCREPAELAEILIGPPLPPGTASILLGQSRSRECLELRERDLAISATCAERAEAAGARLLDHILWAPGGDFVSVRDACASGTPHGGDSELAVDS
jgi:DNA repair protein RadC